MFELLLALILTAVTVLQWRRERRRLRVGVLGLLAAWFATIGVTQVVTWIFPPFGIAVFIAVALLPMLLLVVAVYLIANGVVMFRREGRSLANLLSGLAGLGMLALPPVLLWLLQFVVSEGPRGWAAPVVWGVFVLGSLLSAYAGAFFLVVLLYGRLYRRSTRGLTATAVIVHGSGLIDDRVPPLLAARLDCGIDVFHRSEAAGLRSLIVPSGGKGDDEVRPEGEAMREYLIEAGLQPERIVAETLSVNTEENLRFSASIIAEHADPGDTAIVTSDYHALRAALLAHRLGVKGHAVGARTARYFVPSAQLREFVAIAVMHPRAQVIAVAAAGLVALLTGLVVAVV